MRYGMRYGMRDSARFGLHGLHGLPGVRAGSRSGSRSDGHGVSPAVASTAAAAGSATHASLARSLKRLFDVTAAAFLLALLAPLFAWVAWRIRAEDGGPVLFAQMRVGQEGREFRLLKFRSMVRDADAILARWRSDDPALYRRYVENNFKLPDDPRVMRVGRWLRRASIDELPQLVNVLKGEMSLVGPRPLLARELPDYPAEAFTHYTALRPGITGLWQISGRSRTSFGERAACDVRYAGNWSLWRDLVILMRTIPVVMRRDGAY